jgi:exodeoxyribonuclease V alpha subunit
MRRLVDAVRPDAHLVLLGDRHQLASVESGAVLGEIVASSLEGEGGIAHSVALLRHSFRFDAAGGIGRLAEAVREGRVDDALAALRGESDLSWLPRDRPHRLDGPVGDAVAAGYAPLLRSDTPTDALSALAQFRVLCAHRRGPWGVEGLNHAIEQRLAPMGLAASASWYARRPVMVTANDYRQELFNGDQGVAMPGPHGLRVVMAGEGERSLAPTRLGDVETVFALSIHKSQGSEYDHVLIVLPDASSPLLSRELLYTAITRAKKQVTIAGGEDALAVAIGRPLRRTSGLRERLQG